MESLMKPLHYVLAIAAVFLVASTMSPALARARTFDLQHSKMTVHVYKQGLFSFLADNHTVDAPIASGSFDSDAKTVELTVEAAKMRVLDPALPAQKRETVQSNMVGAQVLDAARFPTIAFRSTKIEERSFGHWSVVGELTLHGQTHPLDVQVSSPGAGHYVGSATVRQTEFGITPIRVAGGAVSVRDEVAIEFDIVLSP